MVFSFVFCFSFFCFSLLGEEREGKEKKKIENVTIVCMRVVVTLNASRELKAWNQKKKEKEVMEKEIVFVGRGINKKYRRAWPLVLHRSVVISRYLSKGNRVKIPEPGRGQYAATQTNTETSKWAPERVLFSF